MEWGQALVGAWNSHDVDALLALFVSTCRYTDMPYQMTWEGHAGLRTLFSVNEEFHPDYAMALRTGCSDGARYAWEWTISGTVFGRPLSYQGVSVGTLDAHGLIVENRDYWNPLDIPGLVESGA